jgi:hypothetical protein
LRGVDAPDGMERRILSALDALEDEASVGARSGWSWMRPMWLVAPLRPVVTRSVVCGMALASLVAVGFLISAFRGIGRVPVQSTPARSKIESPSTGPRAASAGVVAEIAPLPPTRAGVEAVRKTDVRVAARASDGGSEAAVDGDSVAESEMRAASHPAPPMPLTEQERLLLRIVHKDDPVEVAVLNPAWREARDAEDQAEFQRFFEVAADRSAMNAPKVEQPTTEEQPTEQKPTTEQPKMEQ